MLKNTKKHPLLNEWYYKLYADDLEYCNVAFPIFNEVWFTQRIYASVLSVKKNKHEYEV
jgi:hypothetical protein